MHHTRPVAALVAVTIILGAWLAAPANATNENPPPPPPAEELVCEIPQSHEEMKYERDVYEAQVQISKHTRTREKTRPWFTNDWTPWGDWSDPAPWGNGLVDAEWVPADAVPAPTWTAHGSGEETIGHPDYIVRKWERQRALLPNGETRDEFVRTEKTGWLTVPPEGDGWVEVKRRTVEDPPVEFPCPTATATPGSCDSPGDVTASTSENYSTTINDTDPAAVTVDFEPIPPAVFGEDVVTSFGPFDVSQIPAIDCVEKPEPETRETETEDVDCDTDEVTITTTTYETPYVWDPETETYVPGTEVVVASSTSTRPATEQECPTPPEEPPTTTTTTPPPPETPPTTTPPAPAPPAPTPTGSLPVTGSDPAPLAGIAAALIAAGLSAYGILRRFA